MQEYVVSALVEKGKKKEKEAEVCTIMSPEMKKSRICVYNVCKSEIKGEGSKHIDSDLYAGFILLFILPGRK